VSTHFNAYDHSAHGCEVLYKTQEKLAKTVVDKMCAASGFTNRGPKYRSDLKFLNSTEEPAILIETCFCDHTGDSNTFRDRFSEICVAIAEGLTGEQAGQQPDRPPVRPPITPPPQPPGPDADSHPTLKEGDRGEAVVGLQRSLGILLTATLGHYGHPGASVPGGV
jgi:N-acetylmuramoyl-L-alanine amidase